MLVFPEDNKDFITSEIESFSELETKVIGTSSVKLNQAKATLLVNKRRILKNLTSDEEHGLLVEMSRK